MKKTNVWEVKFEGLEGETYWIEEDDVQSAHDTAFNLGIKLKKEGEEARGVIKLELIGELMKV